MSKKFWQFRNLSQQNKGELILYGDISETSWWGDEVTPKQFFDDLKALGNVAEIDVRINSCGGDIFAARSIANYLKTYPATINAYIDGVCASASTYIFSSADKRFMPVDALFMLHDPLLCLWGYYNKKALNDSIALCDTLKASIIETYKARTNLTEDELSNLMEQETWLLGKEAVEKGFADVLLHENTTNIGIEGTENAMFLVANNLKMPLDRFKNSAKYAEMIPKIGAKMPENGPSKSEKTLEKEAFLNKNKGAQSMKLEDFKNSHPDLFNEVVEIGVNQERERIKEIEEVAPKGFENLVKDAKFGTAINAGQLSMNILKEQNKLGDSHLKNVAEDAAKLENPGAAAVEGTKDKGAAEKETIESGVNMLTAAMNRMKGVK